MRKLLPLIVMLIAGVSAFAVYASVSLGNNTTLTQSVNSSGQPQGCVFGYATSVYGLSLEVSSTANPSAGSRVCLHFVLRNVSNASLFSLGTENVTLTDSNGRIAFSVVFVPTNQNGFAIGQVWETIAYWDTAQAYQGIISTVGIYHLSVQVTILEQGKVNTISSVSNLTLS